MLLLGHPTSHRSSVLTHTKAISQPSNLGLGVTLTIPPLKLNTVRNLKEMKLDAYPGNDTSNTQSCANKDAEQIRIKHWHLKCSLIVYKAWRSQRTWQTEIKMD